MTGCSEKVVYLPTDLSFEHGTFRVKDHLPLDTTSEAVFYDNLLEKYL